MASNGLDQLAQIQRDLEYAATAGAARLAAGTVKQARTDAEIGAALARGGPGLSALQARKGLASTTTEAEVDLPVVTEEMATALAEGGAELAVGKRR